MSVSKLINWFAAFLKDKIVGLFFLFTKANELSSYNKRKEYSEIFLNDFNHQEKIKEIWHSLLDNQLPIDMTEVDKIYRLNFTHFLPSSLARIEYYIKNRFWSLLDLFEIDTWNWEDKEVLENASLITYTIIKLDRTSMVVLTSLHDKKYTLLRTYNIKKLPLWKLKRRQLVYSSEKKFLSI